MFTKNDIKTVTGTDAAISDKMLTKIAQWRNMLAGRADWVDDSVESLRLERGVCREFANVCVSEMESRISVPKLDEIYQKAISSLNENLQDGLGLGSMIIKPIGAGKVEYVPADRFIPIEFNDEDMLTKVCFIDVREVAADNIFYRFETHIFENGVLTIRHRAFHSRTKGSIGLECPLSFVKEWAAYPQEISYYADKPIYGFYKNPLPNDIDNSPCGVSVFETSSGIICRADKQFGRLDWEFESGERAVHADVTAFKKDSSGNLRLPGLNKRLYRAVNISLGDGKDLFDVYSPEFRDQSLSRGLEEYKRQIEFNVGLAYGDLSQPAYVEKTAAEIIASKQRKYCAVTAIQGKLKQCLEGLVYGLAFMNGMVNSGYEFSCVFEDSILSTDKERRELDRQEVAMGAMNLVEYRMKWYGEDARTAEKNVKLNNDGVIE